MGPSERELNGAELMISTSSGDWVTIDGIPFLSAIDLGDPDGDKTSVSILTSRTITGKLTVKPFGRRKVTRKRFKKILMSRGISRNTAEELTIAVAKLKTCYTTQAFFWEFFIFPGCIKEKKT
ncbi:MAG: hypothetical protein J6N19_09895 [Clostridium sp.]|nr:hypothetical protein [Clostridium sp.]